VRGGRTGGEDAKAMLNVFESERGGVLNPGRPARDVVPSKYQLDVTIGRKGDGRTWRAQATADVPRTRGSRLVRRMIPGLMEALDETVKRGKPKLRQGARLPNHNLAVSSPWDLTKPTKPASHDR